MSHTAQNKRKLTDLSHSIYDGLITYLQRFTRPYYLRLP